MKNILLISFILIQLTLFSKIRAVWVPIWDLATPEKIDKVVYESIQNNFNQLLAEVRYRGDALYFANKHDSTFANPEKMSYVVKDSLFDPLEYLISKGKKNGIEIHAWLTMYVVTPHKIQQLYPEHIYFTHPNWITFKNDKIQMSCNSFEGAYLDPGLAEVQNYLFNIAMDIALNYDIDGIHLDYIRYPDMEFGYHPLVRENYKHKIKYQDAESWQKWKEMQISGLVEKINAGIRDLNKNIELTAAVIAKPEVAQNRYSQNWVGWLEKDIIDRVYLMAYTKFTDEFESLVDTVSGFNNNQKIVFGLRAWDNSKKYKAKEIMEKIEIVKNEFAGIALFSSTGIRQNKYNKVLKPYLRNLYK
ncbi:MAG: family 10 glycosylhydrolase [Candidatus Cloacimonetes bacterium]|nr:family 10 glycosylhydrolase [Candidatus Cloacimonadota bacterium]